MTNDDAKGTMDPHLHGDDGHHDHPHADHPHADHPHADHPHADRPLDRRAFLRGAGLGLGAVLLAACSSTTEQASPSSTATSTTAAPSATTSSTTSSTTTTMTSATEAPASVVTTLAGFEPFATTVRVVAEGDAWLVESTGMPVHQLMVGITSWQQQVPLPQAYTGRNAWRLPRRPVLSPTPVSARTALYRGAIALAVNGVPIFNALNNRGEDALLAGELDRWGGHAGRADDYHYHVAPWHLLEAVGPRRPFAYALDGFPIYGQVEPDGSPLLTLDEFNGHEDGQDGYHYHGTRTFPYINGGLRGVVEVVDDQVTPQPVTRPIRPATSPLRGATIVDFTETGDDAWRLVYTVGGGQAEVRYRIDASSVRFEFQDTSGAVRTETYARA